MNRLIKNELIKIFKKKNIYITLLIILGFAILTNCIYKYSTSRTNYESAVYYATEYLDTIREEMENIDLTKPENIPIYIDYKTTIEIADLSKKYESNSWKNNVLQERIRTYVEEKNNYLYGTQKDEQKAQELEVKINELLEKLDSDDWRYFVNLDLEQANEELKNLEEQKENTKDKQQLTEIQNSIENAKIDKQIAEYRINEDIGYGNDYLNQALNLFEYSSKSIIGVNEENLEYRDKLEYNRNLKDREESKYIIENKIDNDKIDTRGILKEFFSQYGLFIIILIVMIAGTIVSEEFNKGTVKLLLIKPYSRGKILLSKYLTMLIMIVFSIVAVVLIELVVGGVIFGFDSLSVPVVEYNFNINQIQTINIFAYLGIQVLAQLPMLILLATLAFALSTIFTNSALAITIALLGYMSPSIINALVIQYKVEFMRYFVTMNWNLSEYMFGNLPSMEGMTMSFSIVVSLVYLIIMLIPTFIIFKKKNIKNI